MIRHWKINLQIFLLAVFPLYALTPGDHKDSHVVTIRVVYKNKIEADQTSLRIRNDDFRGNSSGVIETRLSWITDPAGKRITLHSEGQDQAALIITVSNGKIWSNVAPASVDISGSTGKSGMMAQQAGDCRLLIPIKPEHSGKISGLRKLIYTICDTD